MVITIFKIFIWGGISPDIRSEITFTAPLTRHPKTKFLTVYRRYTSSNEKFEYSYPLIVSSLVKLEEIISLLFLSQ